VPSLESSPTASHSDQTILIHGPGTEKFGPISKYIIDGVSQHNRVIYFHHDEETTIREGLSRQGIDLTRYTLKGSLRLQSLGSVYANKGIPEDTPIELAQELLAEAKTLGNEGLSVVLDYDDFAVRPLQKFVQHLTDPRWTSPDHSLHVLMAFDSAVFRGEEPSLAKLESKIRTLDLSESMDTFSRTVWIVSRRDCWQEAYSLNLIRKVIPTGFSKSVFAESASNFQRTVVFTRKGAPFIQWRRDNPRQKSSC